MLSWFIKLPQGQYKRVCERNIKLSKNKMVINDKENQKILISKENTLDYLYGDLLLMEQIENRLVPIEIPSNPTLNLLEHPQIQDFIMNSRNKLKIQIKKYEDVLESLKSVNYEEENFEKEFFDEYSKLRSNLYKNSGKFLQEKLNLTQKKVENMVNKSTSEEDQDNESLVQFLRSKKKENKKLLKSEEISPKVKSLFS